MARHLLHTGVLAAGWLLVAGADHAAASQKLRWEVVEVVSPRFVWVGEETRVRAVIRNAGSEVWSSPDTADHFAYHWLATDATIVQRDGMRTDYPRPVAPGEEVSLSARLGPPPGPGVWLVEWEPVREGVRWLGPPANGPRVLHRVRAVERIAVYQSAFLALTVLLAAGGLALRRRPDWTWWYLLVVPVAWCGLGILVQALGFLLRTGYGTRPRTFPLEVAAAALLALPVALLPVRGRRWAASLLVLFAAFCAYADVIYFRYFGSLVPLTAVHAAGQTGQVADSVRALTRSADGWFAAGGAAALVFALGMWAARPRPPAARLARWRGRVAAVVVLGLVAWPAAGAVRSAFAAGGLSSQVFSHDQMLRLWGVGVTHLIDVVRTGREQLASRRPDAATRDRIQEYYRARQAAAPPPSQCSGIAAGMNLVLIQVESLQQWVIGAQIGSNEVTPFLNGLRQGALYFPFVFDQSDEGRSSDGEFIALNSLHALDRGAVAFRRAGNRFHALPSVLAEAGYTTLSAHAFERGFWNRAVLHPRYGFQTSYFRRELGPGEEIGWGLADHVFFERMVPRLATQKQPFMAFLITLGLHHPFEGFPARHRRLSLGDLEGTPLGNYLHAMNYMDRSLAGFITRLGEVGLAGRTVVALYGDHDAGLDPSGQLLALAGWPGRDASTWPRIDRVPLFVCVPGAGEECRGEVRVEGGHVDIAPTLLDLLGVEPPPAFLGRSLMRERLHPAAGPYGTAALRGVISAAGGAAVPGGDGCWELESGRPLPRETCQPLRTPAREERAISHLVLLHDLVEEINRSLGR